MKKMNHSSTFITAEWATIFNEYIESILKSLEIFRREYNWVHLIFYEDILISTKHL